MSDVGSRLRFQEDLNVDRTRKIETSRGRYFYVHNTATMCYTVRYNPLHCLPFRASWKSVHLCDPLSFAPLPAAKLSLSSQCGAVLLSMHRHPSDDSNRSCPRTRSCRQSPVSFVPSLTWLHFHLSSGRIVFCNLSCNPFSLPQFLPIRRQGYTCQSLNSAHYFIGLI